MASVESQENGAETRAGGNEVELEKHQFHAHFQEEGNDVLDAHDSVIPVESQGEGRVNVRLGFLQIHHVYQISFSVEDDLGEDVSFDPLENLNVKIESASPTEDGRGHNIVIVFRAVKEKLSKEIVTLTKPGDDAKTLTLILAARVLGKGKGTPALKKGIHLLRVEADDESEASDWQGF